MSRWLFAHDTSPPRIVRLAFFAVGLVVLGATYAVTESEGLQVLALFALTFGVLPALSRWFGQRDEYLEAVRDRNAPFSVLAPSVAFLVAWGALVFVAAPDLGLGPWFWWWVVMWPWMEVLAYLGERRVRRDGTETWKPVRPGRDSVLAGLVIAPCIFAIMLLADASIGEALATAVACGVIVLVLTGTFIWLSRRGRPAAEAGERERAG